MPVGLLYTGHSLDLLKSMPSESVQMCMTSPPYWGLRDYGLCSCRQGRVQHASSTLVGSQVGTPSEFSEPDPECAKCGGTGHLTSTNRVWGGDPDCIHEWISISVKGQSGGQSVKQESNAGSRFSDSTCSTCSAWFGSLGLEPTPEMFIEHLVMIFAEVKRVLRDDGTLFVNIGDTYAANRSYQAPSTKGGPKHSPAQSGQTANKVPSGLKSKDLIGVPWMLAFALRADGWYLRQDIIWYKLNPMPESVTDRCVKGHEYVFLLSKNRDYYFDHIAIRESAVTTGTSRGKHKISAVPSGGDNSGLTGGEYGLRNKRSVWTMASQPQKAAHFATYPEELVLTPILAGSKEGDTVLDPFSGSATTGKVALELGREYIGLEQNPEYQEIARQRLTAAGLDCEIL